MANNRLPYRTTLVNFHLPVALAERLDAEAKKTGKPKVKMAIEAFTAYFNDPAPEGVHQLDEDL